MTKRYVSRTDGREAMTLTVRKENKNEIVADVIRMVVGKDGLYKAETRTVTIPRDQWIFWMKAYRPDD